MLSLASLSPAHKRQRLSSPTYEDQLGDLTQEDLAAFDEIEARISQGKASRRRKKAGYEQHASQEPSSQAEPTSSSTPPQPRSVMLPDDSENPFSAGFSSASKISGEPNGIRSNFQAANVDPSPSPEGPPADRSYDDWFKPAPADISAGFGVVSFTTGSSFQGLGNVSFIKPSEASLQRAKARLAAWDVEEATIDSTRDVATSTSKCSSLSGLKNPFHVTVKRPVLATLPNILNTPDTPLAGPSKMKTSFLPPRHSGFKSPLQTIPPSTASNLPGSPLNPIFSISSALGNRHPLSGTPVTAAQLRQNTTDAHNTPSRFSTPVRTNPSSRTRPAKFLTPFKPNMRPGEPGHLTLSHSRNPSASMRQKDAVAVVTPGSIATKKQFFSLGMFLPVTFLLVY